MERAFDADLDVILAGARNLAMHEAIFAKNLKAHLTNAVARVEPTSQVHSLANQVMRAGQSLLGAHEGWLLRKDRSAEETAFQILADAVEQLRAEMRICKPSPMMRALGME